MHRIYETVIEVPIRISKSADEAARVRKLERWPREAGLSVTLDESGNNFSRLVQATAADYGLELGEKKWEVDSSGDVIRARLTWELKKDGAVKGVAVMEAEIPKSPSGEEGNNYVYVAKVKYFVELDEEVLAAGVSSGLVDMSGF